MKMLVIQTGDATEGARIFGNFDDWFQRAVPDKQMHTVHVHKGEVLPSLEWAIDHCSHVIISGSAAMITEQQDWMVSTQKWLTKSIDLLPTLGVCFGHQLLADMLGGEVSYNPKGRNMGLDECELTADGIKDPLFAFTQRNTYQTWVSHLQSVSQLPKGAVRLAKSEKDKNHAFRYGQYVYGVQFHPEWNAQIMKAYISDRRKALAAENFDPRVMMGEDSETVDGSDLIHQFINRI
ncbi:glutamine amidotransferase [Marinicella rhabdoformis]|uniref:glutamine amidotransferase n=1 Tax=Marinicella rhabdoformis TaxID=2580566 RepID=UPI0012AED11D|nr:glutamine amidotransferase [Marinicella rhabdoformis]